MQASATSDASDKDKVDPTNAEHQILEICAENPDGVSDELMQTSMSHISTQQRLALLNRLLSLGKLDLLRSSQGIFYRLKDATMTPNSLDMDEKLVFTVIKEAGNKGIWIRDIANKTNVKSVILNKVLKSLESQKLIKSVASVNASKKKVYMLFDLEPDRSITGGAWYSGKEFESEFVEILNEQCYHYLLEKRDNSLLSSGNSSLMSAKYADPVLMKKAAYASSKDLADYIKKLGISKVELEVEDIETILNTLVYDGKAERTVVTMAQGRDQNQKNTSLYRAMNPIIKYEHGSSFLRTPCGICPKIDDCHENGLITPLKCSYIKDWLDF